MIDVLLDADVLGRQRTGDETYVRNLLRALPAPPRTFASPPSPASRTVPDGVEPIELAADSQEWRMAWRLPRLVRRLRRASPTTSTSLPLRGRPSVLTVHDLSFEREPDLMPRKDRLVFRAVVPRSAKRADRVIAVSERTREDLEDLYGIPAKDVKVIPHGIDPIFTPDDAAHDGGYLLVVGSVQRRKDPRAAVDAGNELGMPVVVVGPERSRRSQTSCARSAPTCAATWITRSSPACTARRRRSSSRPGTRASACRCWRRWRAGRPSSPRPTRRSSRWRATPRSSPTKVTSPARSCTRSTGGWSCAVPDWSGRRASAGTKRAAHGRGLPEPAVSIAGVVVVHEPVPELERCLSALKPQVDELVVVSNLGLELPVPDGT